jgi:ketosteroid isomerase-like protein
MPEQSMTAELEQAIRRNVAALNDRDYDSILATFADDAVWDTTDLEVVSGREAIRGLFVEWLDPYERFEHELLDFRDMGSDVTFTEERQRGWLRGSTQFVENHYAAVTTWSGGLVERLATYQDIDEARIAAERLAEERSRAENVDRTREAWEFFNRTGGPNFALLSEDITWHIREDVPESATYQGHRGVAEVAEQWRGVFEDLEVVIDELIEAGDNVVVVLRTRGRVKGSDRTVEMAETHVTRWLDGKVVEIHEYKSKAEALESVGLEA